MLNKIFVIILLLPLSPLLIFTSLLIFFIDRRPILFKQKRIGKENSQFNIYKFRTMKINTNDIPSHLMQNSKERFTKLGPLIRKLSIDELPQLINIFKGEMNFFGPRPALYNQKDLIELRTQKNIHLLKPGITGWAQVNGRDSLTIEEKVQYDEEYLRRASLSFDMYIIGLTILRVIKKDGISH